MPVIDSRKLKPGDVFFALKGSRADGNVFVPQVMDAGAAAAISDNPAWEGLPGVFIVEDVLQCMQELGAMHRRRWKGKVIAVAGSNGKTTTKELIHAVLSSRYHVFATPGNLNNHIGVPMCLLQLRETHEIAVIEIGANHQGETAFLSALVAPDEGIVTNNGKDHLEGFGSVEGVRKANAELYVFFRENGGHVYVSAAQQDLMEDSAGLSRTVFGENGAWDVVYVGISGQTAGIRIEEQEMRSQLAGRFNEENIAAAAAIGLKHGLGIEEIAAAVEAYRPSLMRSQEILYKGLNVRMDAYNANPTSMKASLEAFCAETEGPRYAVLADMLELGAYCESEHREMVELLKRLPLNEVWLIGGAFKRAAEGTGFRCFPDTESVKRAGGFPWPEGSHVLLKGSRKFALEQLLEGA